MNHHDIDFTDSTSFGKMIDIIFKHLHFCMSRRLGDCDLKRRESMLLFTICEHPGIRQDELGSCHRLEKYEITKMVNRLVEEKYVTKVKDKRDGRVHRLHPTQPGKDKKEELKLRFEEFSAILTDGFTQEEKDLLLAYLKRMAHNIVSETHRLKNS